MKLISKLKNNAICKKALYISIVLLMTIYIFFVACFGNSVSFTRYLIYISLFFLGFCAFTYCFLYDDFTLSKIFCIVPIFVFISLIGTIYYSHDFRNWLSLVLLALSFFVFSYSFKIIKNKELVISLISIAFFLFSLYFVYFYRNEILNFRSYSSESFRLGTQFDNQNGVGAYAIIGFSTSLYLLLFSNRKIRFFFILPAMLSLVVGLTTGSRTFLIGVVFLVVIMLYFRLKKYKLFFIITIVAFTIVFVVMINLPFLATLKERFLRGIGTLFGTGTRVDTSLVERVVWNEYGFYLGFKNLLFGYGVNGFGKISGVGTYAHSNYAELICDFGFFGFVFFYAPLIILLIKSFSNKNDNKSFVISFVFFYLLTSFTTVIYYKKIYYLILAFLFYLVFIESNQAKIEKKSFSLKKITFVCDTMGSGGAEKVISLLSNEFSRLGIKVNIIGIADFVGGESFYTLNSDISYIPISKNGKRVGSFARVTILKRLIKEQKPDVVISFLPNAIIYSSIALFGGKIPYIVSERSNPYSNPSSKFARYLKRIAFRLANGAVFQTNDARNYYSKKVIEKGTIIKNPLEIPGLDNIDYKQVKNKTVLSVGRLTEEKNHFCLIDAFAIFNQKKKNQYALKIYGKGPLEESLKKYCGEKGISRFVVFAGSDPNWQQNEKEDSMFILSSNYEGMPNSLVEAMALGIPSISTDCPIGGPKELIINGQNGFLVPTKDPSALSDAMLKIDEAISLKFFKNTRSIGVIYSSKNIVSQWIDYIMKVAS